MLILWIRRNKNAKDNGSAKTDKESFKKHDQEMKNFRHSHPRLEKTDAPELIKVDGNVLAAISGVRLSKNSQN